LIFSLRGEEFVRLDLPTSKPFGGTFNVSPSVTPREKTAARKINYDDSFIELAKVYSNASIEHERLKAVTLAMMMLESGRGSSDLAKKFNNFGGLKYRQEMSAFAQKIRYNASDGYDFYCEFTSIDSFISGFWAFLDRKPYAGWRKKAFSERAFLEFIAPIYCPFNKDYVAQVTSLLPEARALLSEHKDDGSRFAMTKRLENL
jgi:N-acetylmuramoyl-L-alanine amidase